MAKGKEKPKEIAKKGQTSALVLSKDNLKSLLDTDDFKESMKLVVSKYLTPEKVVKMALLAVSRQPKLLQCTKVSFVKSTIKAGELGLDFAGQTGQGYLVPFGTECQFIPGYQGFIEIAYRSKQITFIDAQLVHEKDAYDYGLGSKPFVNHKPYLDGDRGKVKFGYAVVKLVDSDIPKIEIMTYEDIMNIKKRSKAKDRGPWVTDESEMMRKTVLRRVFKYIPKTPEIEQALEVDNTQFDFSINTQTPEEAPPGVAGLKDRLKPPAAKIEDATFEEPTKEQRAKNEKAAAEIRKADKQAEADRQKVTAALEKCQQRLMKIAHDKKLTEAEDFANFSAAQLGGEPEVYWEFDDDMNKSLRVEAFTLEAIATLDKAIDDCDLPPEPPEEPETEPTRWQCQKCYKIYTKNIGVKCTCLGEVLPMTE